MERGMMDGDMDVSTQRTIVCPLLEIFFHLCIHDPSFKSSITVLIKSTFLFPEYNFPPNNYHLF